MGHTYKGRKAGKAGKKKGNSTWSFPVCQLDTHLRTKHKLTNWVIPKTFATSSCQSLVQLQSWVPMFLHKTLDSALVTHFKNGSKKKRIKQLSLETQVISDMRHSLMLLQVGKPTNNSFISGTFPHPHNHLELTIKSRFSSASRIFAWHVDYYVTLPALELSHSHFLSFPSRGTADVCCYIQLSGTFRTNTVFYICTCEAVATTGPWKKKWLQDTTAFKLHALPGCNQRIHGD